MTINGEDRPELNQKLLDKLAKLKAMAEGAEAIGSEHEAQAFAAMFQELLVKHKVEMTDLEFANLEVEEPVETHRIDYKQYPDLKMRKRRIEWMETLANIVADAFFCRILVHPGSSRISLAGRRSDTVVAEYMIVTLQRAAQKIADKANYDWGTEVFRRTGSRDGPERYGFKSSFLTAFVNRLYVRLRDERKTTTSGTGEMGLMRINKSEKAVTDFIDNLKAKKATAVSRSVRFHREGIRRGTEAANSINLKPNAIETETTGQRKLR